MRQPGKRTLILLLLLGTAGRALVGAATFDTELHHRILNSDKASGPFVSGDVVLFSYAAGGRSQSVSLAFEHENYREFHTFEKNAHGVFVLTVPLPESATELRYRLIVDGLWTTDPNAPIRRDNRGIPVSSVSIPVDHSAPNPGVVRRSDGSVRFVYVGDPGARVSLIGDFNRWDPYLTPMKESYAYPGVYEVILNLPSDSGFYRFVVNGREIADPGNPVVATNGWGMDASPLPR